MTTLLCRRCQKSIETESEADGPRARCPSCGLPMLAASDRKSPDVVPLARRPHHAAPRPRRRIRPVAWGGLAAVAALAAVVGIAAGLARYGGETEDRGGAIASKPGPAAVASPAKQAVPAGPRLEPGTEATLSSSDAPWLWLATEEATREQVDAARRDRQRTLIEMHSGRGKAFLAAPGTRVRVVSAAGTGYWVRVIQGANPRKLGWIDAAFLVPSATRTTPGGEEASPLRAGEVVELIGNAGADAFLAADEKAFDRLATATKGMPGYDVFSVAVGTRADVREVRPDRIRVRLVVSVGTGREGWVPVAEVRPLPEDDEMAAEVIDGRDQRERRRIYLEIRSLDRDIAFRATLGMIDEEAVRKQDRIDLAKRHKIDPDVLKRIELEGDRRRWPIVAHR